MPASGMVTAAATISVDDMSPDMSISRSDAGWVVAWNARSNITTRYFDATGATAIGSSTIVATSAMAENVALDYSGGVLFLAYDGAAPMLHTLNMDGTALTASSITLEGTLHQLATDGSGGFLLTSLPCTPEIVVYQPFDASLVATILPVEFGDASFARADIIDGSPRAVFSESGVVISTLSIVDLCE